MVFSTEREREREEREGGMRASSLVAIVTKTNGPSLLESLLSASDTLLTHIRKMPFFITLCLHG